MLKTSGKQSNDIYDGDAVGFNWSKKSFVADPALPLDTLLAEVSYISVRLPEDRIEEIDAIIKKIVRNDSLVDKIENISKVEKAKLDEILAAKIKTIRKSNKLMDYLREKFNTASLPFKTVIFGERYKATKSRGSESTKPDYEKIVDVLRVKYPTMEKEIKRLEKKFIKVSSTSSRWSNFSEILDDK